LRDGTGSPCLASLPVARVIAVDAGTTGVRALVVDEAGAVTDVAYRELTQHFPRPGLVEHDADEIWGLVAATLAEVTRRCHEAGQAVAAIGLANQRETVVAWDRTDGRPLHHAIVWQDRRTAHRCRELEVAGHLPTVRNRTGLVLDPYFSATKMAWLLDHGGVDVTPDLVLGTIDAWVTWNLTGGPDGGVLATDTTNASRTLLFDIVERRWSPELCDLFGIPITALPDVHPSCGRVGRLGGDLSLVDGLGGVPVSGIAGDQHAALFGQACFEAGMTKATYGTGSFVLSNVGPECPPPAEGLLTTVAWDLGRFGGESGTTALAYALEGSVFATGAAVQWLRDGLGIIDAAPDIGPLAESVDDSEGVVVVPAFVGLGSPWWDPGARGTIVGISPGTGRAQLARAVVESIAHQVRDVVDAITAASARPPEVLRVDGGAAALDLLLRLQADQLQMPVARPTSTEVTALGAATLAGLAEGVWGSLDQLASLWRLDVEHRPSAAPAMVDARHDAWHRAVERSRSWAADEASGDSGGRL
jgi:glycerol kinase